MKQKIKIAVEFETEVDTSNECFANNLAQTIEKAVVNACEDIKPTHDFSFILDSRETLIREEAYRLGNFNAELY